MGREWIEDRAASMGQELDRGHGERVANQLREDATRMSPRDFMSLVSQTQRYDRNGVGDELVVTPIPGYHGSGKEISVRIHERDNRGRPVVYDEPVARIEPPRPPAHGRHPQEQQGLDPESVLLGTAIGIGITAIIRNNQDRRHDGRRR
jgi:hypothetical protein